MQKSLHSTDIFWNFISKESIINFIKRTDRTRIMYKPCVPVYFSDKSHISDDSSVAGLGRDCDGGHPNPRYKINPTPSCCHRNTYVIFLGLFHLPRLPWTRTPAFHNSANWKGFQLNSEEDECSGGPQKNGVAKLITNCTKNLTLVILLLLSFFFDFLIFFIYYFPLGAVLDSLLFVIYKTKYLCKTIRLKRLSWTIVQN